MRKSGDNCDTSTGRDRWKFPFALCETRERRSRSVHRFAPSSGMISSVSEIALGRVGLRAQSRLCARGSARGRLATCNCALYSPSSLRTLFSSSFRFVSSFFVFSRLSLSLPFSSLSSLIDVRRPRARACYINSRLFRSGIVFGGAPSGRGWTNCTNNAARHAHRLCYITGS